MPQGLILIMTFVLAACSSPDFPDCKKDKHCKKNADGQEIGYVCVFGQCQACGRDNDCADGQKCYENRCVTPCVSDASCDPGYRCRLDGLCEKVEKAEKRGGVVGQACSQEDPCQSGLVCMKGICQEPSVQMSEEECSNTFVIYFDYNIDNLSEESRDLLKKISRCLAYSDVTKIQLEGHADERGTTMYNLDLGERRARTVRNYLGGIGVSEDRMRTLSYGEERPAVSGHNESSFQQNRRVEIIVKE